MNMKKCGTLPTADDTVGAVGKTKKIKIGKLLTHIKKIKNKKDEANITKH